MRRHSSFKDELVYGFRVLNKPRRLAALGFVTVLFSLVGVFGSGLPLYGSLPSLYIVVFSLLWGAWRLKDRSLRFPATGSDDEQESRG